jgi:uncharacterized membrane-anchored protein
MSTIAYLNKPTNAQLAIDHEALVSTESRLAVLEQQYASFRDQKDLEFAVQQEFNDWMENQANENFFIVSGLPPPPSKMTGGSYPNISCNYYV